MKLLGNNASPFVRMVRASSIELGLTDVVSMADTVARYDQPDLALQAANPLGKVPALIRDDGPALYDSRVICRYLNEKGNSSLYPESRLWEVLTLEATAHGMTEAALLMVYEHRFRPEDMIVESWVEAQWQRVVRSLSVLETRWQSHLAGPVDGGQIAVACALGYIDFRHADRDWRTGHAYLSEWYAKISERPALKDTAPSD